MNGTPEKLNNFIPALYTGIFTDFSKAMNGLIFINSGVFFLLGALHIYWVLGGKWGMDAAVPIKKDTGKRLFQPGKTGTFIVAIGLFSFALVTLGHTGILEGKIPFSYIRLSTCLISGIFLLRAIGDFRYVGFFKQIKGTRFAESDTRIFSPLCLFLSISALILAL